ncbi:hypothetical protein JIG36_40585 [Actinoplanes sp. LDG1-06]|uniref:Tetracycline repressor TetR C-terminal domain-containing protein n=1 Tax=Paractinoplanes ovalisporus TaxID=2810368 RepID=A0ABS2APQ2_9ACTN|nr:hypothetical protein [Actinoplanes ovalisporus]
METVREFLLGYLADGGSLNEVRSQLRGIARHSTRLHRRTLSALESVLATSWPPETLARLVGWDANWVLDDPSDAGAAEFLRGVAHMLRDVISDADQ